MALTEQVFCIKRTLQAYMFSCRILQENWAVARNFGAFSNQHLSVDLVYTWSVFWSSFIHMHLYGSQERNVVGENLFKNV